MCEEYNDLLYYFNPYVIDDILNDGYDYGEGIYVDYCDSVDIDDED